MKNSDIKDLVSLNEYSLDDLKKDFNIDLDIFE
jgi:hypothetical protein